jgi:hypothetical protein
MALDAFVTMSNHFGAHPRITSGAGSVGDLPTHVDAPIDHTFFR